MTIKDVQVQKNSTDEAEIAVEAGGDINASQSREDRREHEDKFPDAFRCTFTRCIMNDPVVDTSGDSFERKAVMDRDKAAGNETDIIYYPNRALKAVIERELEYRQQEGTLRGNLMRLEESVRSQFSRLVEMSALPASSTHFNRPLPDSFYCPITLELINKAVIDPDGNSFERAAIRKWIRANGDSPVTRTPLSLEQLRDNHALNDLIDVEKGRGDESIHPSIRLWKESHVADADEEAGSVQEEEAAAAAAPTAAAAAAAVPVENSQCGRTFTVFGVFMVLVVVFFGLSIVVPMQLLIFALCILSLCLVCNTPNNPRHAAGPTPVPAAPTPTPP